MGAPRAGGIAINPACSDVSPREVPRRVERLALCAALFGVACAGLAVAIGVVAFDALILAAIWRMLGIM